MLHNCIKRMDFTDVYDVIDQKWKGIEIPEVKSSRKRNENGTSGQRILFFTTITPYGAFTSGLFYSSTLIVIVVVIFLLCLFFVVSFLSFGPEVIGKRVSKRKKATGKQKQELFQKSSTDSSGSIKNLMDDFVLTIPKTVVFSSRPSSMPRKRSSSRRSFQEIQRMAGKYGSIEFHTKTSQTQEQKETKKIS